MIRKNWHLIALACLIGFHLISNAIWINLDKTPLREDPANHVFLALEIKECVGDIFSKGIIECLQVSQFYPPLVNTLAAGYFTVVEVSDFSIRYLNSIFFTFTIIAVYIWTKEYFQNKNTALLNAFFISLLPEIYNNSRHLLQEIFLIGIIYLTFYLLLKTQNFTNKKYTTLAFIAAGIGLMTKWNFIFYAILPFIITIYSSYKSQGFNETIRKTLPGILLSLVIVLPWLIVNFSNFIFYSSLFSTPEAGEPQTIFSVQNWIFFTNWLIKFGVQINFFIWFLVGIVLLHKDKRVFNILFLIAVPYFFLSLIGNKDVRYAFAFLPMFGAVIAQSTLHIFKIKKLLGSILIVFLLLIPSAYYFKHSYNFPKNINYVKTIYLPAFEWVNLIFFTSDYFPAQPYNPKKDWPNKEIIEDIYIDSKGNSANVLSFVEWPQINVRNLTLTTKINGYKNIKLNESGNNYFPTSYVEGLQDDYEIKEFLKLFDYIVIPEHEWGPENYFWKDKFENVQTYIFEKDVSFMELIGEYNYPAEEIEDLLNSQNHRNKTDGRFKTCKESTCENLLLFRVKVDNNSPNTELFEQIDIQNAVPDQCNSFLCDINLKIPVNGWILVAGSPLQYSDQNWLYDASKGEGNLWVFYNQSEQVKQITVKAFPKGNLIKTFSTSTTERFLERITEQLDIEKNEMKLPGRCTEKGCTKVGIALWDCSEVERNENCSLDYMENPVFIL